jgi:Flp pilus assembly pilin Flp
MVAGFIAVIIVAAVNQLGQNAYNLFYVRILEAL